MRAPPSRLIEAPSKSAESPEPQWPRLVGRETHNLLGIIQDKTGVMSTASRLEMGNLEVEGSKPSTQKTLVSFQGRHTHVDYEKNK